VMGRLLRTCAVLAVAAMSLASAVAQPQAPAPKWQPPMGIPSPTFGIEEQAPPAPAPWTAPVEGFYYVEPDARRATDANNPYGAPGSPRATIPTRLPAGAVVELRGAYDASHSSPRTIVAMGTRARPVFIRGANAQDMASVLQAWELKGTYFILEHLRFRARDRRTAGIPLFQAPSQFAVLRHSDISGTPQEGGIGVESWDGSSTSSDVVIWDNKVHDNGDVNAAFDQDRHGIHIGERVSRVWVIDNEMWRNSGDGIQISARTRAAQPQTHHIYVGRNVSHHNKQNGFWTKQAVDVIFSQNTSYGNRPSPSSMGVGLGFQYAPEYVWFLFNHVYDSDFGIGTGSDSGLGSGTESFFIGNLIHDIHNSTGTFKPGTGWHNCGISLPGGVNRHVVNNTIVNADSGICTPGTEGKVELHNNLVFATRTNGQHVFLEFGALAVRSKANGNVFGPNYRALTAGKQHAYDGKTVVARGGNSVARSPGFAQGVPSPYDLAADSSAVDVGIDDPAGVYATFMKRYGLDIRRDFLGRPRPAGAAWDAGAFERQGGTAAPLVAAPATQATPTTGAQRRAVPSRRRN
jgi:hypothetical protein